MLDFGMMIICLIQIGLIAHNKEVSFSSGLFGWLNCLLWVMIAHKRDN